ncbi:MAG: hypothetical protein LBR48_07105, partial [Dysgonamonadaceae bacterium]|nr:hypothetical protein [Dysgonamonadaceae bacterium]
MKKISVLHIQFKNEISFHEIPKFRGAVVAMLQSNNVLFHNHTDDGFRYAYPLIQYKRINGQAAIVCVGEGTEAIGEFFTSVGALRATPLRIGNREFSLELDSVKAEQMLVQVWESSPLNPADAGLPFCYQLRKWLPLNQENHHRFSEIEDLKSRCEFLEKILVGNILSFAKGLGIHFDKEVKVSILNFEERGEIRLKMINFASFDVK